MQLILCGTTAAHHRGRVRPQGQVGQDDGAQQNQQRDDQGPRRDAIRDVRVAGDPVPTIGLLGAGDLRGPVDLQVQLAVLRDLRPRRNTVARNVSPEEPGPISQWRLRDDPQRVGRGVLEHFHLRECDAAALRGRLHLPADLLLVSVRREHRGDASLLAALGQDDRPRTEVVVARRRWSRTQRHDREHCRCDECRTMTHRDPSSR